MCVVLEGVGELETSSSPVGSLWSGHGQTSDILIDGATLEGGGGGGAHSSSYCY